MEKNCIDKDGVFVWQLQAALSTLSQQVKMFVNGVDESRRRVRTRRGWAFSDFLRVFLPEKS